MSDPIWTRIDELQTRISQHEVQLRMVEKDAQRIEKEMTENREQMARIEGKLDLLARDIIQARGGLAAGKWIFGALVSVLSLLGLSGIVARWWQ